MSLFEVSQVCSIAPFSFYSFSKALCMFSVVLYLALTWLHLLIFWSRVRDEIFTLCLCVFKFGYEGFVANSVISSWRLVVCVCGKKVWCFLTWKAYSYFLVWQKRKLSDNPVEAGEDYTKFNSADFVRKVSVYKAVCLNRPNSYWGLWSRALIMS